MQRLPVRFSVFAVLVTGLALLGACSSRSNTPRTPSAVGVTGSPQATGVNAERPVAPETNPAGDIPDTQAFVSFTSQSGSYGVDAPEGWARTETGADVRFVDKLNGETVAVTAMPTAPTAASARADIVPALMQGGRAVQITKVQDVQLPGGPAVLVTYTANSEPNSVTGKQVRLENQAYLFFKSGKLATLTVWAPQGADNVDQWQRIARSFRWS